MPGWKVLTVGDDIAWLHPGADGRLWAINPEAGYFGVVPGTNPKTNRNAYEMIRHDTIFTNVALTADNQPWWEGLTTGTPVIDWQGRPYDPAQRSGRASEFALHRVRATQSRAGRRTPRMRSGVPISAIVFGGRRREVAPLVYEARDWQHGVLVGASVASETTAAAVGPGRRGAPRPDGDEAVLRLQLRRLLAALAGGRRKPGAKPPRIFHVNWFRRDAAGQVPVAGVRREPARAGMDARSLRRQGRGDRSGDRLAAAPRGSERRTASTSDATRSRQLLSVDPALWRKEVAEIREYLAQLRQPAAGGAARGAQGDGAAARLRRCAQPSSQLKRMVCGEPCSGSRPRPIMPSPLICRLSRRTKDSSPSALCTKVPLVL